MQVHIGEKKNTSGDIDIIVSSDKFNLNELVETMIKIGLISDVLSMRMQKFMGICSLGYEDNVGKIKGPFYRLDIEFLQKEEIASGLLYFTGSKDFNISMRIKAKYKGYLLNEHGLYKKTNEKSKGELIERDGYTYIKIPTFCEKDIFEILGMEYMEPSAR